MVNKNLTGKYKMASIEAPTVDLPDVDRFRLFL